MQAAASRRSADADADDDMSSSVEEVEMGLLAGDERASSREGFGNGHGDGLDDFEEDDATMRNGGDDAKTKMQVPLTREDKKAIALLIVLCASSSPWRFSSSCRRHNPPPDLFR